MREYYIRREGDEDSSGPFDIDQIASLIEAEKLDASAYFYDIETENWVLISSNQELMDTLFPKKRKLFLRTPELEAERKQQEEEAKEKEAEERAANAESADAATEGDDADSSDEAAAPDKPEPKKEKAPKKTKEKKKEEEEPEKLDVTRMLALAEGRADDPSGKSPREKQAAVAFFGLRFLTLFFIASAAAMIFIEKDLALSANAIQMAKNPYLIIAAFDVVMIVFLLLQVTEVYPLLRFRAAIGAGLLTMFFYASGDGILLLSNLLLMGAIYFSSAIIKIRYLIVSALAGILGILGYAYSFFLS